MDKTHRMTPKKNLRNHLALSFHFIDLKLKFTHGSGNGRKLRLWSPAQASYSVRRASMLSCPKHYLQAINGNESEVISGAKTDSQLYQSSYCTTAHIRFLYKYICKLFQL